MKRSTRFVRTLGLALAVFVGAGEAQASYYTLDVTLGASQQARGTIDIGTAGGGVVGWSGPVGDLIIADHNPPVFGQNFLPISPFNTVCTDLEGTLFTPGTYGFQQLRDFSNAGNGLDPRWGYDNQNQPLISPPAQGNANSQAAIQNAADIFFNNVGAAMAAIGTLAKQEEWAALQLAVWEALYDSGTGSPGLSLTSGRFTATSADSTTLTLANAMLAGLSANPHYVGFTLYPDPTVPSDQDPYPAQSVFYNVTPVPEPTTMIAGALLLLPFGMSTLRVLRRYRTA